jgi:hypothetical protein
MNIDSIFGKTSKWRVKSQYFLGLMTVEQYCW